MDDENEFEDFELEESPEKEPQHEVKPKKKSKKKREVAPRKPTKGSDEFGLRVGSLDSKAAAMYSSGGGATLDEVKEILGSVKFNVLGKLKKKGFEVTKTKEAGAKNRTVTRYKLHRPAGS